MILQKKYVNFIGVSFLTELTFLLIYFALTWIKLRTKCHQITVCPPPAHGAQTDEISQRLTSRKQYYDEINYFRGLVIFLIVWSHMKTLVWSGYDPSSLNTSWEFVRRLFSVLVTGNTAMFVFISGFLFYAIFYKRGFDYKTFIKGKILKVFVPWFLISTVFLFYRVYRGHGDLTDTHFVIYGGYFYWSFWYIPFIMLVFFVSPLYLKFIELSKKSQFLILGLSTIISMCLGRHETNPVLSLIFWNSFYLYGIFLAQNYQKFLNLSKLDKQCLICMGLLIIFVSSFSDKTAWFHGYSTYDIHFGEVIEWALFAKIFSIALLLFLFIKIKSMPSSVFHIILKKLAKYSFSIFFLQQFFILWFERNSFTKFLPDLNFWEAHIVSILFACFICYLCIFFAFAIKTLTGKYSRMIIGA